MTSNYDSTGFESHSSQKFCLFRGCFLLDRSLGGVGRIQRGRVEKTMEKGEAEIGTRGEGGESDRTGPI